MGLVLWHVSVAFGDPRMCFRTAPASRAAAGVQSPALAGILTPLSAGRWSTFGALRASAFLSWDSKYSPLHRLPWCGPLPVHRRFPISAPSAKPCQWLHTFRPRRFSRPRRLTPAPRLRTCCIPLPTLGFVRFPVTSSRDLPHTACRLPLSCLTALCRSPSPFQQAWCVVSRLSPSSRTPTTLRSFPRLRSRLLGHLRCSHFNEVRTTVPAFRRVPVSWCTAPCAIPLFPQPASVPRPVSWLLLGRLPHSARNLASCHSQLDLQRLPVSWVLPVAGLDPARRRHSDLLRRPPVPRASSSFPRSLVSALPLPVSLWRCPAFRRSSREPRGFPRVSVRAPTFGVPKCRSRGFLGLVSLCRLRIG